ncbi:hypothetical protein KAR91_69795 [Candidatus Pacearchaeota archaeon]|nr:hypothetical protein [Candidatus Pacearchaeota archaeon]
MEGLDIHVVEKIEKLIIAAHKVDNSVIKVGDQDYWASSKDPVVDDPRHVNICVSSLSAISGYMLANREGFKAEDVFIHVDSPENVFLMQKAGHRNKRTCLMTAGLDNDVARFPFCQFMSTEEFIIGLMSRFEDMGERADIVSIASSLRSEKSLQADDTGATTNYEAKNGVVTLSGVKIPDVIELYPFRTFRQVEQPGSAFLFRYRADENGRITVALFEADGGAWKHKAMESIAQYFKKEIPSVHVIA